MGQKRRQLSGELKARVVLDALREQETLVQLASRYKVHPNPITKWKKQAREGLVGLLNGRAGGAPVQEQELVTRLYEQIGRLLVELDWK